MGRVTRVEAGAITVAPGEADTLAPLKPGDGVVLDAAGWRSPEEPEEGGRIFHVERREGAVELRFANGAIDAARIRRGDLLWRTSDPDIERAARPYLNPAAPLRKQPVRVRVAAREGAPLETEWQVGDLLVSVHSEAVLGAARNRSLTAELLREQLGRLGNTPYELAGIDLAVEGAPFAPASLLNQVRREAVERLQERQGAPRRASPSSLLNRPRCPHRRAAQPLSTFWCAPRSNWMPPWICGPPASRWIISISTACGLRSSACAQPISSRAWPARAC